MYFSNVFLKMYFSNVFIKMYFSNVSLKMYFSKCISQNVFLKMYFSQASLSSKLVWSKCLEQWPADFSKLVQPLVQKKPPAPAQGKLCRQKSGWARLSFPARTRAIHCKTDKRDKINRDRHIKRFTCSRLCNYFGLRMYPCVSNIYSFHEKPAQVLLPHVRFGHWT